MTCKRDFSLKHYSEFFRIAINEGYNFLTCSEYIEEESIEYKFYKENDKLFINRIDVDLDVQKAVRISDILNEWGIRGSFFIRLHAKEYNPFSFENYRGLKYIIQCGHEVGLHSEVVDCSNIWNEIDSECFVRDLEVFEKMFGVKSRGVASHGGITIYNNLDFWGDRLASDFGLEYEAYKSIFKESFYVSDAQINSWKCYNKGVLVEGDDRCLCEHLRDGHKLLYVLTHPISYYERHVYE